MVNPMAWMKSSLKTTSMEDKCHLGIGIVDRYKLSATVHEIENQEKHTHSDRHKYLWATSI